MSQGEVGEKLDELIRVQRQTNQWLRVLAWDDARDLVSTTLQNPVEYHLYEELDGDDSISEILDTVPIPESTGYRRLDEWQQAGIISKVQPGVYDHIAPLESLGLDLPELEDSDE